MSRIALAGCRDAEDPDAPALVAALGALGLDAAVRAWDDPAADWSGCAATVIRSTWDYFSNLDGFLRWARSIESLVNPADVVAWNADKRYLGDLDAAGIATIPTTYATRGADAAFPDGPFVVKPTVGGGSRGAARYEAGEADRARAHVDQLASMGLESMVQPLVASVVDHGETDVVVIDGAVSHAVTKRAPMPSAASWSPAGPSTVERVDPSAAQLAVVEAALAVAPCRDPLCFARVDLVELPDGPAVIEVELIEPFLFLSEAPAAAAALAAAIARRAAP